MWDNHNRNQLARGATTEHFAMNMNNSPDIVDELQKLTPDFALEDLVLSAYKSFELFDSFYRATSL